MSGTGFDGLLISTNVMELPPATASRLLEIAIDKIKFI